MSRRKSIGAGWALVAALALVAAAPATGAPAKDGDVRVAGTCTKSTTSKLKLSRDDGRLEVEFEVDQNRVGVRWAVVLRQNGAVVRRTTGVTRGRSGSFEVRRLVADRPGTDTITAVATRPGERCGARASI